MQTETEEFLYPVIYRTSPLEKTFDVHQFDSLLLDGWRFLGKVVLCHSISYHFGDMVLCIPGRIVLEHFTFSQGQRKTIQRGQRDLRIELREKEVIESDERLFALHCTRFTDNAPVQLSQMVHYNPIIPQRGYTIRIYAGDEHVATSFFHLGHDSADSTYCIYNPDPLYNKYSLGNLTLYLEIMYAQELGLKYYYLGYRYNVPSQFDYKANFNSLEKYHLFREWVACERKIPKKRCISEL